MQELDDTGLTVEVKYTINFIESKKKICLICITMKILMV